MSPASTSGRAAPDGPIPSRLIRVVPVARRPAPCRRLLALVDPFQVADQLRRRPARRIPRPDPGEQRPGLGRGQWPSSPRPGSGREQPVQLEIIRVWSSPRDRRRSARTRSTASRASPVTRRSPSSGAARRNRVRIGRIGLAALPGGKDPRPGGQLRVGTSTTRSPAATSREASCLPKPQLPSTFQVRSGHRRTAASVATHQAESVPYRPLPQTVSSAALTSIAAERSAGPCR